LAIHAGLSLLLASTSQLHPTGAALVFGLGMLLAGALSGALIFGAYLAGMSSLGFLTTNGYSAMAVQDFKGFLRFHISDDGALYGHFIAIDQVPKAWDMNENQQPVWKPGDLSLNSRVHDQFVIRK
jgi:hypothetical protein